MGVGEFKAADRYQLDEAIRRAEQVSRREFSVFVGRAEGDPRAFATRLHNSLVAPSRSIMIMLDPSARVLEIITGGEVRRVISDQEVELVALQMQSYFQAGDLGGGLKRGIQMLAEHSTAPETLHTEQP